MEVSVKTLINNEYYALFEICAARATISTDSCHRLDRLLRSSPDGEYENESCHTYNA